MNKKLNSKIDKTRIKTNLSAKVPPELKDAIASIAAKEDRSVSRVVVRLLEESPTLRRELASA